MKRDSINLVRRETVVVDGRRRGSFLRSTFFSFLVKRKKVLKVFLGFFFGGGELKKAYNGCNTNHFDFVIGVPKVDNVIVYMNGFTSQRGGGGDNGVG